MTIFGQSAGAESVGTHLVSPQSRGLFHRAIMQSNPYSLRFRTKGADSNRASTALAKFLGCSTCAAAPPARAALTPISPPRLPVSRDCLNAANSSALLAAQVQVGKDILATLPLLIQLFEVWTPVIDGKVLTDEPWQLLRKGGANPDVDIMMGTTQNEGVLFGASQPPTTVQCWRPRQRAAPLTLRPCSVRRLRQAGPRVGVRPHAGGHLRARGGRPAQEGVPRGQQQRRASRCLRGRHARHLHLVRARGGEAPSCGTPLTTLYLLPPAA